MCEPLTVTQPHLFFMSTLLRDASLHSWGDGLQGLFCTVCRGTRPIRYLSVDETIVHGEGLYRSCFRSAAHGPLVHAVPTRAGGGGGSARPGEMPGGRSMGGRRDSNNTRERTAGLGPTRATAAVASRAAATVSPTVPPVPLGASVAAVAPARRAGSAASPGRT